jgi:membrane protein required for colicin V production
MLAASTAGGNPLFAAAARVVTLSAPKTARGGAQLAHLRRYHPSSTLPPRVLSMQSYDFLMLAVLIGCMVFGAWKGMAWQVASLASIVASYFGAVNFSGALAPMISAEAPWNKAAAMLIIYLVSSIGIWTLFRLVANIIDSVRLRDFDRQVGAMFGAFKGVLLCMVITFFAVSLSETARGMVQQSHAGYYMTVLLEEAHPYVPERVHEVLHPYVEQFKEKLNQEREFGPGGVPQGPPRTAPPGTTPPGPFSPGTRPGPAPQPPRSFPNLLSGTPGGEGISSGGWRPNTSAAGGNAAPRLSDSSSSNTQPRGLLDELGNRFFSDWTGTGNGPTGNQPKPAGGRIDNPSYGDRSSLPSRPGMQPPPAPAPGQRAANQPANQPPRDGCNDFFGRSLEVLRTLEEFGTTPSPTVPPRQRR